MARSTVYGPGRGERVSDVDAELLRLIDAEYTRRPFYGSRRMRVSLRAQGYTVSRKRIQRLMRTLGLAAMLSGPHTMSSPRRYRLGILAKSLFLKSYSRYE